jgi:ornithine cyclodeaminase/alanine dehydrogenase-like protein (mu-crystallin family)
LLLIEEALSSAVIDEKLAFTAARDAFLASSHGGSTYPVVVAHIDSQDHRFTVKSASIDRTAAIKIGSYWPSNDAIDLPRHGSTIILLDPHTGRLKAVVEAAAGNAYRTAAADPLATSVLARDDAQTLTIIGTGHQAAYEARAVFRVRDFQTVLILGRRHEAARQLEQELQNQIPGRVEAVGLEEGCRRADVLITATTSTQPIFTHSWTKEGTHISAMGADGPEKQELPPAPLEHSSLFCDVESQSRSIGEFRHVGPEQKITELGAVLRGTEAGRATQDPITVFDSSRFALQDLALAQAILDRVQTDSDRTKETR